MQKLTLVLLFLALPASAAPSAPATAKETVQTIVDRASKLDNKATRADNARVIESLVDFDKLAKDALGDRGKDLTPAQRTEVRELLRKIITKTVYPEAPKFFRDVKLEFTGEEPSGEKTHITSVVTKGSKRSTVEYWLAEENHTYRVVDLAIEGERWVENVHDQFDEVIAKNGASGLISRMKKRLTQLESGKK